MAGSTQVQKAVTDVATMLEQVGAKIAEAKGMGAEDKSNLENLDHQLKKLHSQRAVPEKA
jgi:hypothetical protein